MLKVENISSGYGKKQVLFDVYFEIGDSQSVLLTGGNGSGKSTVLKCIYRLLPLWNNKGNITFNGNDITKLTTSEMVKIGIVYIPQKNNCFESLTVNENLMISGSIYTKKVARQRIDEIYQLPYLYEYRNRTPFNLSGGERQLLALGIALIHKPKLVLFDEPFAGLDELNTKIIFNELLKFEQQKIGMLIVEHNNANSISASKEYKMELGKLI